MLLSAVFFVARSGSSLSLSWVALSLLTVTSFSHSLAEIIHRFVRTFPIRTRRKAMRQIFRRARWCNVCWTLGRMRIMCRGWGCSRLCVYGRMLHCNPSSCLITTCSSFLNVSNDLARARDRRLPLASASRTKLGLHFF